VTPALTDATLTRVFIAAVFAAADVLFTPTTAAPAPTYETAKAGAWPSHRADERSRASRASSNTVGGRRSRCLAAPATRHIVACCASSPRMRLLVTSYAHRRRTLTKPEHQTSGFSATCYG